MKKIILLLAMCCVLAVILAGCKSSAGITAPPPSTVVKDTIEKRIIMHDTVVQTQKDSTYKKMYLECVNGKVVERNAEPTKPQIGNRKGKALQEPKTTLKDNVLEVDCYQDAQNLFLQWKETYIKEHKSTVIKIPYPVPLQLSGFQKFEIYCGRILWFLILAVGIGFFLKYKNIV